MEEEKKKQQKQIKTQGRHLLTFNRFNTSASNCQCPWWLWTKHSFIPFCLFTLWFPSLFRLIVIVLCQMPPPQIRFSVKITFITYCSQCQQLICIFLVFFFSPRLVSAGGSTSLEVKKHHYRRESKKKGDGDMYNSHLSMDEMASFHLFLALIAKQDYT